MNRLRKSSIHGVLCVCTFLATIVAYIEGPKFVASLQGTQSSQPLKAEYNIFSNFLQRQDKPKKKTVGKATQLVVVSEPSWCKPCRKLEPTLKKLTKEGYDITVMSKAQYAKTKNAQRVSGVPTLIFKSQSGKVIRTSTGNMSRTNILKTLIK